MNLPEFETLEEFHEECTDKEFDNILRESEAIHYQNEVWSGVTVVNKHKLIEKNKIIHNIEQIIPLEQYFNNYQNYWVKKVPVNNVELFNKYGKKMKQIKSACGEYYKVAGSNNKMGTLWVNDIVTKVYIDNPELT